MIQLTVNFCGGDDRPDPHDIAKALRPLWCGEIRIVDVTVLPERTLDDELSDKVSHTHSTPTAQQDCPACGTLPRTEYRVDGQRVRVLEWYDGQARVEYLEGPHVEQRDYVTSRRIQTTVIP